MITNLYLLYNQVPLIIWIGIDIMINKCGSFDLYIWVIYILLTLRAYIWNNFESCVTMSKLVVIFMKSKIYQDLYNTTNCDLSQELNSIIITYSYLQSPLGRLYLIVILILFSVLQNAMTDNISLVKLETNNYYLILLHLIL